MPDGAGKTAKQMMHSPERFLNRELSWLDFNRRVLEEASNPSHPLLERLRFLSISASNLDEFEMVRYAGLREQVRAGVTRRSQEGLTPGEQIALIEEASLGLIASQQARWRQLKEELETQNIFVLSGSDLNKRDKADLDEFFRNHIFPVLTPLAVDPAHPFPFIPNLGFSVALDLVSVNGDEGHIGIVPLPAFVRRFIRLPRNAKGALRFIPLEDVIGLFVRDLFPGFKERERCLFRIVRDSDIEIEEEAEDLIREFEVLLKQRRRGRIVRLRMQSSAPKHLRDFIIREIGTEEADVVLYDGLVNPYDGQAMGVFGEMCVEKLGFTREEQDAFAVESVKRSQAAIESGAFRNEIAPVTVASRKGDLMPLREMEHRLRLLDPA